MDVVKKVIGEEVQTAVVGPPHWQDGVCSCCADGGIACQTICCLPCTVASVLNMRETLVPTCDCYHFCCFMALAQTAYPSVLGFALRRELIQRYHIRGESTCGSCCVSQCCPACSFCQVQREMAMRKEHAGGCCTDPPADQPTMADRMVSNMGKTVLGFTQQPKFWGSSLFSCGCAEFLEGYFCPCFISGYQGAKLDAGRIDGAPTEGQTMDPIACCGSMWFNIGWWYANRREVIERYQIVGENHVMSFLKVICCPMCALLQQRREMGYNGEWPGGLCVKEAPVRPGQTTNEPVK